jgi:hypothetical protein
MQLAHGMWLAHSGGGFVVSDDDAVASLRRAVAINPDSHDVHAWLALNLMSSPATRGEARAAIDRAIRLAPGRLDYLVYLADLYLLDEQMAPARALLRDVAAIAPDDVVRANAASRLASLDEREQQLARVAAARAERVAARAAAETAGVPVAASPVDPAAGPAAPADGTDVSSPAKRDAPNVVSLADMKATYVAATLAHASTGEQLILMMRRPRAGEQRVFATLTHVECRQGPEIRFHAVDGTRTIVTTAGRFPDVELTAFRPGELLLGCGRRSPVDRVALTFTTDTARPGIAGTAVALEFLPDGYGPAK